MTDFSEISKLAKRFDDKIDRCITFSNTLLNEVRENFIDMALSRNTLFSGENYNIGPTVEARVALMTLYLNVPDEEFAGQLSHYPIADTLVRHWLFGVDTISQPQKVAELAKEKAEELFADSRVETLTSL